MFVPLIFIICVIMNAKIRVYLDKTAINLLFLRFFIKNLLNFLLFQKKAVPLHPQMRDLPPARDNSLGYGVMVTLQILVLPFLVRVRVPQQINPLSR